MSPTPGTSGSQRPKLSFGLFVRNAEKKIERCLDSLLAQDFQDFEIVVSDNASTDHTPLLLQQYAERDPRVRAFLNPEDAGQIENCNRVFREARGEYYRWIGADDWLEPSYASRCVELLDADPGAIGVTTGFRFHFADGSSLYEEIPGERLESERAERRYARMLWSFHAKDTFLDPIYSMMRRDVLEETGLIRMMVAADWMLAAELSLSGRFRHLPECLANRGRAYEELADREATLRRYHPTRVGELPSSPWRLHRVLRSIVAEAPLSSAQRLRCARANSIFLLRECGRQYRQGWVRFRRQRLGLTRERLRSLQRRLR